MKKRLLFLVVMFLSLIPLMALQKPLFMLYHLSLAQGAGVGAWLAVMWHGLSLDMTIAGYLMLLPVIITLASVWWRGRLWSSVLKIYIGMIAVVVGAVFATDMALYSFWGFKIDASIWFYLRSPKDAAASIEWGLAALQILIIAAYALAFYFVETKWVLPLFDPKAECHRTATSLIIIVMGGLLVLPIRGGVTASTANESRAYFSSNMFLNHSAVNPCFSLLSSSMRTQSYSAQYHFMDEEQRKELTDSVYEPVADSLAQGAQVEKILKTERPNVIMIVLEGFAGNASEAFGGDVDAAANLSRAAHEGVMFSNVYANSFRTDRGLVSIINAFPGQPTSSIMKFPSKSQTLPSIASSLRDAGYRTSMYYGGDIDFTNMRSFFYSSGYDTVVGQDGLTFSRKPAQWGYDDELMFGFFGDKVEELASSGEGPFFTTLLTLSSHEPFEVPYTSEFDDVPYLNSVAFTDHFLGAFLDRLRNLPLWNNTLVVLLPDHSFRYPADTPIDTPDHFHIPLVFTGGAVEQGRVVEHLGTQVDMAVTLLSQMGLPTERFTYGKNLLDGSAPQFAFYTFNNGFVFMEPDGWALWDCKADAQTGGKGENQDTKLLKGKALLQTLLEDFDAR